MEILRRFPLKYFAKVDFTEFCQYINPRSTKQKSNSTMLFKKTLYKNSMVLISNERNGTVLLLDILAQLRGVRARITEETEKTTRKSWGPPKSRVHNFWQILWTTNNRQQRSCRKLDPRGRRRGRNRTRNRGLRDRFR